MKWTTACAAIVVFTAGVSEPRAEDDKVKKPIDLGKEGIIIEGRDYGDGRLIRDREGKITGVERDGDLGGIKYNPCNSATPPSWCPKT
jgi:hypothetical protein